RAGRKEWGRQRRDGRACLAFMEASLRVVPRRASSLAGAAGACKAKTRAAGVENGTCGLFNSRRSPTDWAFAPPRARGAALGIGGAFPAGERSPAAGDSRSDANQV